MNINSFLYNMEIEATLNRNHCSTCLMMTKGNNPCLFRSKQGEFLENLQQVNICEPNVPKLF